MSQSYLMIHLLTVEGKQRIKEILSSYDFDHIINERKLYWSRWQLFKNIGKLLEQGVASLSRGVYRLAKVGICTILVHIPML